MSERLKKYLPIVLIVLATLAFGALFFSMPLTHDDYWFLKDYEQFGLEPDGHIDFWKGIYGTIKQHHLTDNSRLSNIFGAVLLTLPFWLTQLISSVSVGITLVLMTLLSLRKRLFKSLLIATLVITSYAFAIPWCDMLFTGTFTYNYIWSGALMLLALWGFLREKPFNPLLMLLFGVIVGAWHEIFSFPALIGCVACFAFHRKMLRTDRAMLCLGLALGCLWLWMSPSRINETGYGAMTNWHRPWRYMIGNDWLSLLFLAMEAISLLIPRLRRVALSPIIIFAITYAIVCLGVYLVTGALRSLTPAIIMSTIGILYLFHQIIPTYRISVAENVICFFAWIFFAVHMAYAIDTGYKIKKEEKYIISEYLKVKETDGVVFAPTTGPQNAPWLAFGKPFLHLYDYYSHPLLVSEYYHGKLLKVIPPELKFYRGEGIKVASNYPTKVYKGLLVSIIDEDSLSSPMIGGRFYYNDGTMIYGTLAYPFTGADSSRYVYLSAPADDLESIELEPWVVK